MATKTTPPFSRPLADELEQRLRAAERPLIQIVSGPRQVGKTTLVRQVEARLSGQARYITADDCGPDPAPWLEAAWQTARQRAAQSAFHVLMVDEVQLIPDWSRLVKRLWDGDTRAGLNLRIVLLGSNALLMKSGLSESLAGRFEVLSCRHWDPAEMAAAFGYSFEDWLVHGGYPGLPALRRQPRRLADYVQQALVDAAVGRDILALEPVRKPGLLKQVMELIRVYSGEILSYNKILGQLQDAGNGTTVAHYVDLLQRAGLVIHLQKEAAHPGRRLSSIPKLLVADQSLMRWDGDRGDRAEELRQMPSVRGRVVETAIGGWLWRECQRRGWQMGYWREGNHEVDFTVRRGRQVLAIEVKSGTHPARGGSQDIFRSRFPNASCLVVGEEGRAGVHVGLEEFLRTPLESHFPPADGAQ